jgi:hypothetical protein
MPARTKHQARGEEFALLMSFRLTESQMSGMGPTITGLSMASACVQCQGEINLVVFSIAR